MRVKCSHRWSRAACWRSIVGRAVAGAAGPTARAGAVRSPSTAASSSTRGTRRCASSPRSSASSSTTCSRPSRTERRTSTGSTARPTRTRRRRPTSTASTRRCTRTSRPPATRRSGTATRSAATSSTTCRSSTGSTRRVRTAARTPKLGQLLDVAYNIEYGAECSVQSSLNLLYLLGYSGQGQLNIFGPSNEKYHVVGGNDRVPNELARRLSGQINPGSELVAISSNSSLSTWTLTFKQGLSTKTVTASSHAQQFLRQIDPLLPGLSAYWNGKATIDFWTGYQWTKGSYSYWKVGQYTKFSGIEKTPQGTCHFAGEHTSQDFRGYLNGGVETGERAANEILAALR